MIPTLPRSRKCGTITKAREELRMEVREWTPGSLVIGGREVGCLLDEATVRVNGVLQRGDREPIIDSAGAMEGDAPIPLHEHCLCPDAVR